VKTNIHFLSYRAQFFLEWAMFRTEVVQEIKTHFMFSNSPPENSAVCEIMWKHVVEGDCPQMTIWCMHIACWITKSTETHTQHTLQQWLKKFALLIRLYVHCVSCIVGIQFIFFISNYISGCRNICNTSHIYFQIVKLVVRCLKLKFLQDSERDLHMALV